MRFGNTATSYKSEGEAPTPANHETTRSDYKSVTREAQRRVGAAAQTMVPQFDNVGGERCHLGGEGVSDELCRASYEPRADRYTARTTNLPIMDAADAAA